MAHHDCFLLSLLVGYAWNPNPGVRVPNLPPARHALSRSTRVSRVETTSHHPWLSLASIHEKLINNNDVSTDFLSFRISYFLCIFFLFAFLYCIGILTLFPSLAVFLYAHHNPSSSSQVSECVASLSSPSSRFTLTLGLSVYWSTTYSYYRYPPDLILPGLLVLLNARSARNFCLVFLSWLQLCYSLSVCFWLYRILCLVLCSIFECNVSFCAA